MKAQSSHRYHCTKRGIRGLVAPAEFTSCFLSPSILHPEHDLVMLIGACDPYSQMCSRVLLRSSKSPTRIPGEPGSNQTSWQVEGVAEFFPIGTTPSSGCRGDACREKKRLLLVCAVQLRSREDAISLRLNDDCNVELCVVLLHFIAPVLAAEFLDHGGDL